MAACSLGGISCVPKPISACVKKDEQALHIHRSSHYFSNVYRNWDGKAGYDGSIPGSSPGGSCHTDLR